MARHRIVLVLLALFALSGCVAYPADGYYAQPAPVYVAPPSIYVGGGYRPYYGGYRHGGWGHRGWR